MNKPIEIQINREKQQCLTETSHELIECVWMHLYPNDNRQVQVFNNSTCLFTSETPLGRPACEQITASANTIDRLERLPYERCKQNTNCLIERKDTRKRKRMCHKWRILIGWFVYQAFVLLQESLRVIRCFLLCLDLISVEYF